MLCDTDKRERGKKKSEILTLLMVAGQATGPFIQTGIDNWARRFCCASIVVALRGPVLPYVPFIELS